MSDTARTSQKNAQMSDLSLLLAIKEDSLKNFHVRKYLVNLCIVSHAKFLFFRPAMEFFSIYCGSKLRSATAAGENQRRGKFNLTKIIAFQDLRFINANLIFGNFINGIKKPKAIYNLTIIDVRMIFPPKKLYKFYPRELLSKI